MYTFESHDEKDIVVRVYADRSFQSWEDVQEFIQELEATATDTFGEDDPHADDEFGK